jgi:sporulation protein YlmC with PRC-barrel domain
MSDIHHMSDTQRTAELTERLKGRSVFDADGNRLGTVRDVHVGASDQVTGLVVGSRWMLGQTHVVSAAGMHMEHGDIMLARDAEGVDMLDTAAGPSSPRLDDRGADPDTPGVTLPAEPLGAINDPSRDQVLIRPLDSSVDGDMVRDDEDVRDADMLRGDDDMQVVPVATTPAVAPAPVEPVAATTASVEPIATVAPGDVVRRRFGGLDVFASFTGTLVAIAMAVLLGGILAAIAGSTSFSLSTGSDTFNNVGTGPVIAGFVALFLAYLVGGWSAGRMARYDGAVNGMMLTFWTIVLAIAFGALGAWIGDAYNVLPSSLPNVDFGSYDTAGVIGTLIALAVMLVAGAFGGLIGEAWHRRADRVYRDAVVDPVIDDRPVAD